MKQNLRLGILIGWCVTLWVARPGVAQDPGTSKGPVGTLMEGITIEKIPAATAGRTAEPAPAPGKKADASAMQIAQAEKKRPADDTPDRLIELETELAAAEAEKKKLARDMDEMKKQMTALAAKAAASPAASQPAVAPGSDLFGVMERENAELKRKLADVETAMAKAEQERAELMKSSERATAELSQMKSADEKEKQALGKMTAQLPDMERELTDLRASVKEKDDALREREKALQAMAVELDRREHRMVKAERMSDMLEKARSDLVQVSDREKRDMHFNMASVYARDGEYREAETEYLRALRIDPGDADAHYNLGILYDDHLDQKRKAALYYKRYLKLRPDATDVDQVKAWLLNIEMQTDK